MALSKQQQAELDRLQALADAPEPRTETGLAGILHHLIDVTSGRVAHVSPDRVDELHSDVEQLVEDQAAQQAKVDEATQVAGAAHQAVVGAAQQAPPEAPAAEPEDTGDHEG